VANINGWGRGTWNEGAWSTLLPVPVTGLAGTGGLGSVTATAAADVAVTGLAATGVTGNVLVWSEINPDQNPSWAGTTPNQTPEWTEIAA
jgi:hypothetical protein